VSAVALLELRPVRAEDEPFLAQLFAVTEHERLAFSGLTGDLLNTVVRHEFAGQQRHYSLLDQEATHCIIIAQGNPAGRLVFWENREEIRLAELAIAPAFRGLGIGSAVVDTLKAQAGQSKRPLRLHAEKYNLRQPRRFYQRLGFRVIEDRHTHWFMEWEPARAGAGFEHSQLKMIS
jgi:ribosomal protein S18 acetylase RimI-like enzyme